MKLDAVLQYDKFTYHIHLSNSLNNYLKLETPSNTISKGHICWLTYVQDGNICSGCPSKMKQMCFHV